MTRAGRRRRMRKRRRRRRKGHGWLTPPEQRGTNCMRPNHTAGACEAFGTTKRVLRILQNCCKKNNKL